jgi:hypothetical protein
LLACLLFRLLSYPLRFALLCFACFTCMLHPPQPNDVLKKIILVFYFLIFPPNFPRAFLEILLYRTYDPMFGKQTWWALVLIYFVYLWNKNIYWIFWDTLHNLVFMCHNLLFTSLFYMFRCR